MAGEKTEKATPKKRQKAREKGQVAKSTDVSTALILLVVFLMLLFSGGPFVKDMMKIFQQSFSEYALTDVTESSVQTLFSRLTYQAAKAAAPFLIMTLVIGIAANVLQIGFQFSTQAIQMKLDRLNPIQGAKKMFSLRALVELAKSSLKISFIGFVTFGFIWFEKDKLFSLGQMSPASAATILGKMITEMGLVAAIVLIFISILDFVYQRFDFEKNLKMSKQEVRDEHKDIEGDPKIKGKIRERQRQMAMRRMMQEV
ncbi:MAG TPA: EscU/YscU/HrcU family type III secretion system export apparatus switch protein, partial [Bacillales bacterium]|nr:EscU/YscU/HrcU family type III secretion system export apparatus switch protein [Bacillales bacterium]